MTKEFSLSDNVRETVVGYRYTEKDVKEFIKELKERVHFVLEQGFRDVVYDEIDKLIGKRLVEDSKEANKQ